ncbi:MAG TPA: hypothetical protein VFZ79_04820, partial [Acidimicrobiales bacterium]
RQVTWVTRSPWLCCVTMAESSTLVSQNSGVATLQIKNVSETFMRRVRAVAAERGETVRRFVLEAVSERLERLGFDAPDYDER